MSVVRQKRKSTKAHSEWPKGLSGCEREKGYSLIEVLIYSSILALFLLLVVQVFIAVKNVNAHSTAFVGMQRNLRQIVADMNQTLKMASSVTTPLPGQTSNNLSLDGGDIVYQVNDGVLQKTASGQTWDLTTEEVAISNLSFENAVEATQTATIKIEMEVESNYLLEGGRRLSENFQTTISLR